MLFYKFNKNHKKNILQTKVIAHLSDSNFNGAFSAAFKIHKTCQNLGYHSKFYCRYSSSSDNLDSDTYVQNKFLTIFIYFKKKLRNFLSFYLKNKQNEQSKFAFYQFNEANKNGINKKLVKHIDNIDILFVHWVTNFINFYDLKRIKEKTNCKIIFTMMDMANVTGGCHYSNNCLEYVNDCNNCPAITNKKLPIMQLNSKKEVSNFLNAEIISFSKQDHIHSLKSSIYFSKYHHLTLPYDSNIFRPLEKLNNKQKYFNVLGSAFTSLNLRKGPDLFFKSLKILDELVGEKKKIKVFHIDLDFESKHNFKNIVFEKFNFIKSPKDLVKFYNSMDLIMFTSVADAAPQMMTESLMCGVPVVSFNVGEAENIIENGVDGFVIKKFDTHDLSIKSYVSLYENPINWATKKSRANRASKKHSIKLFKNNLDEIIKN